MNVTKYTDNAPELDTLRETYIYRIAAKVAHHVRPTAQEISYIRREVRRQHASPTGLLLRGWLFDFSPLMNAQQGAQMDLF